MSTLSAKGLVKRYRTRNVVDHVSLHIHSGEVVGLLGPNGAGKTTCFYMIVGLIKNDGGQIMLDDHDITRLPMHDRARRGIGYLPQEPSVFRKLSVADNIMAILELRKSLSRQQRKEALENLMEEFHITHLRKSIGISLSGGERRRVEIARALAMEPSFILLDEPFAGIDPLSVVDLKRIIAHLQARGIGILITDHNVRETLSITDRAYIISEGSILVAGTPSEIAGNELARKTYLGDKFKMDFEN